MNQPKQSCVNISINILELIVFITHIWLYGRFYISEFTCFVSFSPDLCCVPRPRFTQFLLRLGRLLRIGWRCCEWGGSFIALIWHNFYCTLPRQLILHLHHYNILRYPRGTHSWVSRSKKCLVKEWQYSVILRYSLTTYIIPFLSADVWKKADKKRLFVVSLFLFSF